MSEWANGIIDMAPGRIAFRGREVEDLIGNVGFAQMIWLMLRGDVPSAAQAALLEAALVAGVDHGPQAPSIAAARMAASCGVGLNNVMATGVNMLGDVHGGAGEQCAALLYEISAQMDAGKPLQEAVLAGLNDWRASHGQIVSGFGHRFHKPVEIAMNIDGATAVIFCELGFAPPLARGLFCLSRSVGILAHGWEEMQTGSRNKGPMPPRFLPPYKA